MHFQQERVANYVVPNAERIRLDVVPVNWPWNFYEFRLTNAEEIGEMLKKSMLEALQRYTFEGSSWLIFLRRLWYFYIARL